MAYRVVARASGEVLAATDNAQDVELVEGQWYFAPAHVHTARLARTERTYTCPYKGLCYWYDLVTPVGVVQNVAWVYDAPKPGYAVIAGRYGFYGSDTPGTLAQRTALA